MAMCSTGSLGIIAAPQAGCSSIALGVCGSTTSPPYSLTTLSVDAGKTAPHCMREFYGYENYAVNVCICFTSGGAGSNLTTKCGCLYETPTASAGCYCVAFTVDLNVGENCTGNFTRVCIQCNGTCKYYCCIAYGAGAGACEIATVTFPVTYLDTVDILAQTCSVVTACPGTMRAFACISSITPIVCDYRLGSVCKFVCAISG